MSLEDKLLAPLEISKRDEDAAAEERVVALSSAHSVPHSVETGHRAATVAQPPASDDAGDPSAPEEASAPIAAVATAGAPIVRCPTRPFGATGLEMPILSCGGMRHDSPAALDAVVARAISFGVNHFETARMYMGGRSEADFGRALAKYPRASLIIQTKVAPHKDGEVTGVRPLTRLNARPIAPV